jgi:hypothetical protein
MGSTRALPCDQVPVLVDQGMFLCCSSGMQAEISCQNLNEDQVFDLQEFQFNIATPIFNGPFGRPSKSNLSAEAFASFAHLVSAYSQCKLSYQSDILEAFAGIISTLGSRFDTVFLYGLPKAHFWPVVMLVFCKNTPPGLSIC